jgi:replication-associated recombination protein RarA
MRPKSLADMVGQQTIIGDGRMLRRAIEHDTLFSMILCRAAATTSPRLSPSILKRILSHCRQ